MKKIMIILVSAAGFLLPAGGVLAFLLNKKVAQCHKGSGPEAVEACTLLIKYSPTPMLKAFFLGDRSAHYEKLGDKQASLEDLKTLVSFDESGGFKLGAPLLMKIYGKLALVNGELGKEAEAVKYAEEAIKLGSSDPSIYLSLGALNIRESRFNESLAYLERAESLGADPADVNFYFALARMGLLDFDGAYERMKKAEPALNAQVLAGKRPQTERGRFDKTMGFICAEKKNYAEAEQYLLKAISSGYPCPECEPALAQLRQAVKAEEEAAAKKTGKKSRLYR